MILLLGDIHGNFNVFNHYIKKYNFENVTFIQVGDFGIGYDKEETNLNNLTLLNNSLKETNNKLLVVRGNHDNPSYFNGNYVFSNLELLPDYTIKIIDNKNFLFIGGAISVDRQNSISYDHAMWLKGRSTQTYWYDEKVVYNEDFIKNVRNIDVLITHTTTDFCYPSNKKYPKFVLDYFKIDPTLQKELKEERELMTKIFNELKLNNNITHHYYGHFHTSKNEEINGVKHILLNINELIDFK